MRAISRTHPNSEANAWHNALTRATFSLPTLPRAGHRAFSDSVAFGDFIGLILHSCLLVSKAYAPQQRIAVCWTTHMPLHRCLLDNPHATASMSVGQHTAVCWPAHAPQCIAVRWPALCMQCVHIQHRWRSAAVGCVHTVARLPPHTHTQHTAHFDDLCHHHASHTSDT
jgi:hypothetical protein